MQTKVLFPVFITLVLGACATTIALQHDLSRPVAIRSLVIRIEDPEAERRADQVGTDLFATIGAVQRAAAGISQMLDEEQVKALDNQLREIEGTLVEGLAAKNRLTLAPRELVGLEYRMTGGFEMSGMVFRYAPSEEPEQLDLIVTVNLESGASFSSLEGLVGVTFRRVVPRTYLEVRGFGPQGRLFWHETFRHRSSVVYNLDSNTVLGVQVSELENKEVFLMGIVRDLIASLP